MKVYKTQSEVEKDIKDGVLAIEGDVKFECSISTSASIIVTDGNITARDITAGEINARDITAWDINSRDINARDILYHAFCCVYQGIKCKSIKAKRHVHQEPICLDGKLEIINQEVETIEIGGIKYSKQEVEEKLKDLKAI